MAANDIKRRALVLALSTAIAIPAEGLRRAYYYDPAGILTVCYGSTTDVDKSKVYSLAECRARLDADMLTAADAVERCVPGLPVAVHAAFADAAYNLGPRIACDATASTLRTWAAQPGQTFTLALRGTTHTVVFNHDGNALSAEPVIDFCDPDDADHYILTLRFLEL